MMLKIVRRITTKYYIKGFYRLLWMFRGPLRTRDDVYTVHNHLKIKLNHSHYYQWMMATTDYYGFGLRIIMEALLEPGDIFVDVGANIGYISLLARSIVRENGFVLAFEPDPRAISLYKNNMSLNNVQNYVLIEKACADKEGVVTFKVASHLGWSTALEDVGELDLEGTIRIPQCTLESVVSNFVGEKAVKLIKIDVEGYEPFVLGGAHKVIKENKTAFIIEVNNERLQSNNHSVKDILDPFSGGNYVCYWIVEHRDLVNSLNKVSFHPIDNVEEYYGKDGDILIIPATWIIRASDTLIIGRAIEKK